MFKISSVQILCFLLLNVATSEPVNKTFPDNFSFGVATSAFQVEGAWNEDGKGENNWDHLIHTRPETTNRATADISCDCYHKYKDDVQLMKNLGLTHYRFSLSWSRILPTGFVYKVNQAGVDYYRNLIGALKENGIEPYVTLYHWDLPQPLQDIGGWTNPILVDYFADYARLAFSLFGDEVKNWMTFNEPRDICYYGYELPGFPPAYLSGGVGTYMCGHVVLQAHAKAYHIYDEEFRETQNGRVSFVVNSPWYDPLSDNDSDKEAAERANQFYFGWFANPVYHPDGNYPQVMIDRIAERSEKEGFSKSRLPEFTPEEVEYIKGTFDFLSINNYGMSLAESSEELEIGYPSWSGDIGISTISSWENSSRFDVVSQGMRKILNFIDQNYNHPEIVITENGVSLSTESLEDPERVDYIREFLSRILETIYEDGINVTGYTVWSLLDNFEWNLAYTVKYGIYHVDFSDPNRTRTARTSADFYKKVIANRCLVDACEPLY